MLKGDPDCNGGNVDEHWVPMEAPNLQRYGETKSLLRKTVAVAHRVLGADNRLTLTLRANYALALCRDAGATLDDLREALNTIEEIEPTARRVFGGAHPLTVDIVRELGNARAAIRAREPKK